VFFCFVAELASWSLGSYNSCWTGQGLHFVPFPAF
jgi:hypothetical protein